jgi:Spy/CpxP family protein refolding chaperone
MTTKRVIAIAAIVVAFGTVSVAAWGVHSGVLFGGDGPFGGKIKHLVSGHIGRLLVLRSQLDITREQKQKIGWILKGRVKDIAPIARTLVEKRAALRQQVMKESPDEKAIRSAVKGLADSIGDAAVLASKIVSEVRPVLTPNQVKLVEKFRADSNKAVLDWINKLDKQ